jgi:hypothetical protein
MGDDGHGSDLQVGESARPFNGTEPTRSTRSSTGPSRLKRGFRGEAGTEPDDPAADRLAEGWGRLASPAQEFGRGDLSLDPFLGQLGDQHC